jgi:hypothetical protein
MVFSLPFRGLKKLTNTYTKKQQSVLNLVNKLNKTVFSPNELYTAQGKDKPFSRKAISVHLSTLRTNNPSLLTRVKKGQYMLTETINAVSTNQFSITPKEELPGFLAYEDIDKLIEWKNASITDTNATIDFLKLKIVKLEKQKQLLNNIQNKFC